VGVRINTAGRIEVKGDTAPAIDPRRRVRPKATQIAVFDGGGKS
jgi:hypothetical protein